MSSSDVYLLALLANVFFSSASMVFSIYARRFSPLWMNQFKVTVSVICFALACFYTGWVSLPLPTVGFLLLSGLIGLCVGDILLFKAFTTLGAARSLVLFSFEPLLLGLYGWFFLRQGISNGQLGAVGCMIACLLVFVLERNKQTGHWDLRSFFWAFAGILLDSVGVMLTRTAYEISPGLESMQVNVIRCGGALLGFFLIQPRAQKQMWGDFFVMKIKEKALVIIACICGTFISLSLYLAALKYAHVASLTAVSITGPVWVSMLECIWERRLPNRYLVVAFIFFLFGFYLMS